MLTKLLVSGVAVLVLGVGAAYATTQIGSSNGTEVCVNQANGLIRVSSTCREGEYPLIVGGGGSVQVTQRGTLTVTAGSTSAAATLPLTGVSVTGRCEVDASDQVLPKILISALGGMDAFASASQSTFATTATIGGTSLLVGPLALGSDGAPPYALAGTASVIVTANGSTATLEFGAQATLSTTPKTCKFLWQAVEAPN